MHQAAAKGQVKLTIVRLLGQRRGGVDVVEEEMTLQRKSSDRLPDSAREICTPWRKGIHSWTKLLEHL